MSFEWVMPSHPLSSPSPALNLSQLWLFASGGQSIRAPPSASVLPMNIHGWFPLGLTGLFSLLSKELSPATQFKNISSSTPSLLYGPICTFVYDYWKNQSFDYMDIFRKVMSLLFNILSKFVIAFIPKSKCLLISWIKSLLLWITKCKRYDLQVYFHLYSNKCC